MKKLCLTAITFVLFFGLTVMANAAELMPATGGIGTKIFYIVGGVLVVGAAVLIFVRSRMK